MQNETQHHTKEEKANYIAMLSILLIFFAWSAVNPHRWISWLAIAAPTVFYITVLIKLNQKFKFTTFAYFMVFIQVILLFIGSKYTYECNPLFSSIQEAFHLSRNYFDRVAHFAQGFTPFFLIKEYLLRRDYMKRSKLFYLIVIGLVLACSAVFELLEFAAVLITNQPIISPQGDPWDTHWDMIMALVGAGSAHLFFGKFHDKKMDEMK